VTATNISTPDGDPAPVDRARGVDLGSAGPPGYCAAVAIGANGEEHLLLAPTTRVSATTDRWIGAVWPLTS
jgi:hypothetical protein